MNVLAKIHYETGESYANIAALAALDASYICKVAHGVKPLTPYLVGVVSAFYSSYLPEAKEQYMARYYRRLNRYLNQHK